MNMARRRWNDAVSYEVPLSRFNGTTLHDFRTANGDAHEPEIFSLPLVVWKYMARCMGPTSRKQTGKYLQMTDQYDLEVIARRLDDDPTGYKRAYRAHRGRARQRQKSCPIGWAFMDIWGGNESYRRIVERISVVGYVQRTNQKSWLVTTQGKHYNVHAHHVKEYQIFHDWHSFREFLGPDREDVFQRLRKYYQEHGMHVPQGTE